MGLSLGNLFSSVVDPIKSLAENEEIVELAGNAAGAATGGVPWGSIASAAAGGLNFLGQKDANATNMQLAQNQMDFQREMSNTSYQRAVEDMKKAGLNPMLAYSQGGASSPGGASTTVQNKFSGAVQAAQAQQLQNESIKQLQSQTMLNNSTAAKTQAETLVTAQELKNRSQSELNLKEDMQRIINAAKREGASADQIRQLTKSVQQAMTLTEPLSEFNKNNPRLAQIIQGLGQFFSPTVNAAVRAAGR
jgi:hypothetical protein